ncbi:MAG: glycosyltransferase, partial [Planctomycetaceae bacterium]
LGPRLAKPLFHLVRPVAFGHHCRPLNRVRREFGLPSLGFDLRRIYTHADFTLYADAPELFPLRGLPPNHRYLGPVLWSPSLSLPEWWPELPARRPVVYLTLGSSGRQDLLPVVVSALADLPVVVIVATAGQTAPQPLPPNVFAEAYLPGEAAARRASLVICNGGSPTTQQALAAGTPVLGLAGNMDQHLNMRAICKAGAGLLVRSDAATLPAIRDAAERLLAGPAYREAAAAIASAFGGYNARGRFRSFVDDQFNRVSTGAAAS